MLVCPGCTGWSPWCICKTVLTSEPSSQSKVVRPHATLPQNMRAPNAAAFALIQPPQLTHPTKQAPRQAGRRGGSRASVNSQPISQSVSAGAQRCHTLDMDLMMKRSSPVFAKYALDLPPRCAQRWQRVRDAMNAASPPAITRRRSSANWGAKYTVTCTHKASKLR